MKPTKCIKCKKENAVGMYVYMWEGIDGNACQPCGREIHAIGFYLLDKAADIIKQHKIDISGIKEKFGRFIIYSYPKTKKQQRIITDLEEFYTRSYPELTWEFM